MRFDLDINFHHQIDLIKPTETCFRVTQSAALLSEIPEKEPLEPEEGFVDISDQGNDDKKADGGLLKKILVQTPLIPD